MKIDTDTIKGIAFGMLYSHIKYDDSPAWVDSKDSAFGSFIWVCDALELQRIKARKKLLGSKRSELLTPFKEMLDA